MALDEKSEIFVVYMVSLNLIPRIYLDRAAPIVFLLVENVKIPDKYSDFANLFSKEKALVLSERTEPNKYTIDLEDGK